MCIRDSVGVGVYAASAPPEVTRVLADGERTALPDLRVALGDRLVLPNCSDLTWASIDFDEATLAALPARLGELADPLARSVCWQSLDDGVARGVVHPRLFLDAIARSWPRETHPALFLSLIHIQTIIRDRL